MEVSIEMSDEIASTDRREAELAKNGFMPLSHYKNTDYAVFMARSRAETGGLRRPGRNGQRQPGGPAPFLFATVPVRSLSQMPGARQIGSFKEREDMETWLTSGFSQYCCDPSRPRD